ncbi:MAG: alpha/beta hydrolase [Pontixanthobacter sp.]
MGYRRIPYLIVFEEQGPKDAYGGEVGRVALEAHLLKPEAPPHAASDTVMIFMHPIGLGHYLPLPGALAGAGTHTIFCGTRYHGADYNILMEKVVLDLAACIRHARDELGYSKIILGGWSGGGSLSLFYQSQAEAPTVTATPAGDPPDLTKADLPAADGVILVAAHVARATTLTEWLDPSILDEDRPLDRDPELNLYDSANPHQPPYSQDYLARYRQAQIDRNRRITARVEAQLEAFRDAGDDWRELGFVVQGTMADPRWLDPAADPNGRAPGRCYLGDPRQINDSPIGLARYSSLRSWMSQWSIDHSHADGVACAARTTAPTLVIGNGADDACTPSHTGRLFDALQQDDRSCVTIAGANHYYAGQKDKLAECVTVCQGWLAERGFGSPIG